jgi:hypothetical protein
MSAYIFDADIYCDDCAPNEAESDSGESDCPQNCSVCHCPLYTPLTKHGVEYVLDKIRESLREGREKRRTIHPCYKGTYYEGSQHGQIVEDWTRDLSDYFLEGKDGRLVELFLAIREGDKAV